MKTPNLKRFLATAIIALPSGLFAIDTDSDGLDDSVETNTRVYVSPTNTGTDPNKADSDEDGAGDWYEVATIDTNPNGPQPNAPNDPNLKPNIPYPLPAPDNTPPATDKPVKVYILTGQSNMVGQGNLDPLGTPGTLSTITRNEHKFSNLLNGAGWSVRNDVAYRGVIAATGKALLTAGQGGGATVIGPELGFGHVMGYFHDEPVLLIKSSQGGRALGWDFLPPGSVQYTSGTTTYAGYGNSPSSWPTGTRPVATEFYGGYQYDQCFLSKTNWARAGGAIAPVFNVTDVLDNFATEYPEYAAQGFEIAGFAWWQGWNDGLSYTKSYADRYEVNMAQFIRKIREYYFGRYPGKINSKAPFVLATSAFNGWDEAYLNQYPTRRSVINAQLAVGDSSKYPEFAGNVKTMEARGYWREAAASPAPNAGYHYNRSAETFMLVGDALGRAMIDLLGNDTTAPTLTSSGIADNKGGGPVTVNTVVTYTVTFSEDMDAATVSAADFGNAGTATASIGTVTSTIPSVFSVPVTPTSAGTLQLKVIAGAELKDVAGNALVTTPAIADDTTITVNDAYAAWTAGPFQGTLTNANPALDFDGGGLATGIEWVVGGDPTTGSDDAGQAPTIENPVDPEYFIFTYRRTNAAQTDIHTTIAVEYGSDPGGWTTAVGDGTNIIITPNIGGGGPGVDLVQVKIKRTLAVGSKLFARLKVVVVTP